MTMKYDIYEHAKDRLIKYCPECRGAGITSYLRPGENFSSHESCHMCRGQKYVYAVEAEEQIKRMTKALTKIREYSTYTLEGAALQDIAKSYFNITPKSSSSSESNTASP